MQQVVQPLHLADERRDAVLLAGRARTDGEVRPLHDGYAFAALPATVERLVTGDAGGLPSAATVGIEAPVRRVVLVLLDGFGRRSRKAMMIPIRTSEPPVISFIKSAKILATCVYEFFECRNIDTIANSPDKLVWRTN